ncbi:MAG: superoxide dismutase family protein [Candidatus Omnitrophota bacterium]
MKFKTIFFILALISLLLNFSYCQEVLKAKADLYNPEGNKIGTVYFEEKADIVKITVNVTDLPPGTRALHIHEEGRCDPPDFKTAGGHFNPYDKQHGFLNPEGPHAGDLPNFEVNNTGMTTFTVFTKRVTLEQDHANSISSEGGRSVIVHENPDDYITDPAGMAGNRIACGIVESMTNGTD